MNRGSLRVQNTEKSSYLKNYCCCTADGAGDFYEALRHGCWWSNARAMDVVLGVVVEVYLSVMLTDGGGSCVRYGVIGRGSRRCDS